MWIEKQKNGKFKACERYIDPMTGKEKKISVTIEKNTAASRKMASSALADRIQQKIAPAAKHDNMTVGELIELYLADQKATTKASTYRRAEYSCKNIRSILGKDTIVSRLTSGYIRSCILATKKEAVTMNENLKRTKMVLRWGYKNEFVENVSYLDRIDRFKDISHRKKIQDKFLESSELKQLTDGMIIDKWKDFTLFLALTGMRIGEALALNISDINLSGREIRINKTYDTNNKVTTPTKTLESIRDISIQDELYPLLKRIRRSALAYKFISKLDLLFQDEGGRYEYDAYRKYLKENSLRILNRKCTPHILRHTHTSLMAEQGIPLDVISRRLGHADSRITKEIYFHVTENLKKKDNALFRSISIL